MRLLLYVTPEIYFIAAQKKGKRPKQGVTKRCPLSLLTNSALAVGVPIKGVGPGPTLAWPGWKQPDIPVEVDTDRLETSCSDTGVLKKLSLAGIAKLSWLKYR
jgi:hypothetical protein